MEAGGAPRRHGQGRFSHDLTPEEMPSLIRQDTDNNTPSKRLIISVDFGCTYSCVSYVALKEGETPEILELDKIKCIQNFPDNSTIPDLEDKVRKQVPTEVIYPQTNEFRKDDGIQRPLDGEADNGVDMGSDLDDDDSHMDIDAEEVEAEMNRIDFEDLKTFYWGYGVHKKLRLPKTHKNPNNKPLLRFKLLLDNSQSTQTVRDDLRNTLKSLKRRGVIDDRFKTLPQVQVIADFLTYLLRHTQSELQAQAYDNSWKREMVLCVPAIWSQKACRDMQTAMATAMVRANFEGADMENNSVENLFLVSEPEAAAAYALAGSPTCKPGDTFVLIDAGGGTVDANTYTVSQTTPLRLQTEVVQPKGDLIGSSYINEHFRKYLKEQLRNETYLETETETIDGIIERIVIEQFEYRVKRQFDYKYACDVEEFPISNLRDSVSNPYFRNGCIRVPRHEIRRMFAKVTRGIASLMEDQIREAMKRGCRVESVILIGGFAESPTLRRYLSARLNTFSTENNCKIKLDAPGNASNAVATGGVLRAFNKLRGPERKARSSYGLLRTEPFYTHDDEKHMNIPEHAGVNPWWDPADGGAYIKDTIDWVLRLGDVVPPVWSCEPIKLVHTIPVNPPKPLVCREVLYVSDTSTLSHYKKDHNNNKGAEKVGEIVTDFSFLRDQGLIEPVVPDLDPKTRKPIGKTHYRIEYKLNIRVVDRDLQCYAVYDDQIVQKCSINIASGFRPGVK